MANGVSKNQSFHSDFKNVYLILVKNAPKKSFIQKTILLIEVPENWFYWAKLFVGALFTKVKCIFLKSV
jgi:hypothetical protein